MGKVFYRHVARQDLILHYVYLSENANEATAERFLSSAEESCNELALHPKIGAEVMLRQPQLEGLRKWRVDGFEKFLIFYLPHREGVSIVRVLHVAQNWWKLLDIV